MPLRSADELRGILGPPHPIVIDKVHYRLTDEDLDLPARSPLCALSTSDAAGNCDVSPRGDGPGFTRAAEDRRVELGDDAVTRDVDRDAMRSEDQPIRPPASVAPSSQHASMSALPGSPVTVTASATRRHPSPVVMDSIPRTAPVTSLPPCT